MRITIVTPVWNEEDMLPFFIKHYQKFADRIVLYDNESTDRTVEIGRAAGCEIVPFKTGGKLNDIVNAHIKSTAHKHAVNPDEDWIMTPDCDEFLWNPQMRQLLEYYHNQKINVSKAIGYAMIGDRAVLVLWTKM